MRVAVSAMARSQLGVEGFFFIRGFNRVAMGMSSGHKA